ncbi:MAG: PKD domain-containing protein, partial [Candidatus Cloacimonadaceae bacterium]|nr:PKD domain-containing protein [Candidatus Cloacimonadaceae bacterium]
MKKITLYLVLVFLISTSLLFAERFTGFAVYGPIPVNTIPMTADFTAGTLTALTGQAIQFTDSSLGSPTGWSWDFNNNGTEDSSLQNPLYSYDLPGIYTVKLTITNGIDSVSETRSEYITVSSPLPNFVLSPTLVDFTITYVDSLATRSVVLTNSGNASGLLTHIIQSGSEYFSFAMAGGESFPIELTAGASVSLNVYYHPLAEGVHNGQLLFSTDYSEILTLPLSGSSEYYPQPLISLIPNPLPHTMQEQSVSIRTVEIVNSGAAVLNYSVVSAGLPDWLSFSSGTGSVAANGTGILELQFNSQNLAPNPPGTPHEAAYIHLLQINSNDPLNPSYTLIVQLLVVPLQLQVEFSATPLSGSAPLTVQFTDQSVIGQDFGAATITGWRWDFNNDGIIDSWAQHPSHVYTQPGVYSVKLTVISSSGIMRSKIRTNYISISNTAPQIVNPLPVIDDMNEDEIWGPHPLIASPQAPNGIFSDPQNDPLTFSVQNSAHITVHIMANHFQLSSAQDWHGTEFIAITATDPFGESVTQAITVTVNPVNDAPVLSIPATLYFIRNSSYMVDFGQYIHDPDNPDEDISIIITSLSPQNNITFAYTPINQPGIQGQLSVLWSAPLNWVGTESFQLAANDHEGRLIATAFFNMTVLEFFDVQFSAGTNTATSIAYSGQTVHFTDNTLGNPDWWQWEFRRNGIPINTSTLQNPQLTFNLPGSYSVSLLLGNYEANLQDNRIILNMFILQGTAVDIDNIPPAWTLDGSPYNLYGDFDIPMDQTVQIDPDVVVNIFTEEPVDILGAIIANNVTFQAQTVSGFWSGFVFSGAMNRSSSLTNSRIINAQNPVQVLAGNPTISNVQIAPADTTQMINGNGISLHGAANPSLNDIEIQNYSTGIVATNFFSNDRTTPITNVRVRNSTGALREDQNSTGIKITGSSNIDLQNIEIEDFGTAMLIDGEDALMGSTPTITNVRVRNSTGGLRNLNRGIEIRGAVGLSATDLQIDDVHTGLALYGNEGWQRDTAVITNVRIRNSTGAQRSESIAMLIENLSSIQIHDLETEGFASGMIISNESFRSVSTPTITNVRIRNSTGGLRQEAVGIKVTGSVSLSLDDAEIEGYQFGLKYDCDGANLFAHTPTITNVRVRNSTGGQRQTSIGAQFTDLKKLAWDGGEILGYTVGMEITGNELLGATAPTITNVRVRNSTGGLRSENIGIYLGAMMAGKLENNTIEEAAIGIMISDGNRTNLLYNKIINCETGIRASGIEPPQTLRNQIIILEPLYQSQHPELQFRAFELHYNGPWLVRNNTIWNYPQGLKAQSAHVGFTNNILYGPGNPVTEPFALLGSTLLQSHNNIHYQSGIYPGIGNINANPLFLDVAAQNYMLHYNSPCIDAGNPLYTDSDGTVSDIGAYTYLHAASMFPSARFIMTGTSVTFTNTSIGHDYPETIVSWDLNDNGIIDGSSRNWTHQFNSPGMYDLRLRMSTGSLLDSRLYRAIVVAQNVNLIAPQNPAIAKTGNHISLSWDTVSHTVENIPIYVSHYIIYRSDSPSGVFDFVGFTENGVTNYTHFSGAIPPKSFYFVIGF